MACLSYLTMNDICGHLDRPHEARGRCKKCYNRWHTLQLNPNASSFELMQKRGIRSGKALCHPDRNMDHSNGRCRECHHIWSTYGIDFLTTYKQQAGLCALCTNPVPENAMVADHNHATNTFRGLVCDRCNKVIAYAEHHLLEAALVYIRTR